MADPVTSAIVGGVAQQTTQSLTKLGWNQIRYVIDCQKNINSLEQELEKLVDLRNEVAGRVERDINNAQIVNDSVHKWLKSVDDMKTEVEKFLVSKCKAARENKGCCTPDLCSKYRLGKESKKKTHSVFVLKQDGNFTEVSQPPPLPDFESTSINVFEHFQTRAGVLREIMEALKDDEIKVIGIHGMGGVGKTRMVEEVGEQVEKEKDSLFHKVVIATISQTLNIKDVQEKLADQLGLKFDKQTEDGRANELRTRLTNEKKTLVILDDVWKEINLKEIGIPIGVGVTGCKIVLTTRKQDVCDQMKVQKKFPIGVLSEDEAWTLFKTKVGNSIISSLEMSSVAKKVCRECGGLPLALLAVGAVLMNSEKHAWDDVLEQLRKSKLNNVQDLEKVLHSNLELSYNYLEQNDAKCCFLLCCLFPEDAEIDIEDLVAYGMGMRLFDVVDTIEKVRNRVKTMVDILKTSCLLLEGRNRDCVKMHDVMRDVAISIASTYLVRTGIQEWPTVTEIETYERYTAISFWSTFIQKLPNKLECPNNIRVFVLERRSFPKKMIPWSFFNGMEKLTVLVLTNMSISSPESSISYLVNLRMLCLYKCDLVDISFLKELINLENLSLNGSQIGKFVPENLSLEKLRRLDLRTSNSLGIIPTHVISSLSHLEEFYMAGNSSLEELEATDKVRRNASLSGPFPKDTLFQKLTRFKVFIGDWREWFMHHFVFQSAYINSFRALHVVKTPLKHWFQVLLFKAEALDLRRLDYLDKVFHDTDRKRFSDLKWLNIENAQKLEHLLSLSIASGMLKLESLRIQDCESLDRIIGNEGDEEAVGLAKFPRLRFIEFRRLPNLISFYPKMKYMSTTPEQNQSIPLLPLFNEKVAIPALEELIIRGLNMKDIWDKKLPEDSFCHLKVLRVEQCHNLVSLIPFNMLQMLQNLEEITISYCDQMTCEVEWLNDEGKNEAENIIELLPTGVKNISLRSLPKLTQTVLNSGILTYMNLTTLSISGCDSLRNVFSASTARSLIHLKKLRVSFCNKMEEIVSTIEEEEGAEKIVFRQLEILKLRNLPTLGCFCNSVFAGENVPQRPLFSDKVALPCLMKLKIGGLSNLTELWQSTVPTNSFCSLRELTIRAWDKLLDVDSSKLRAKFPTLQECEVYPFSKEDSCEGIDEESSWSDASSEGMHSGSI